MVVQKAIDNLKGGPKEDKVAVASGVAITIVVLLMVLWGIFFFRKIAKGAQDVNLSGGAQDEFNFSSVKDAQEKLKQQYGDSTADFQQLRIDAAAQQTQQQTTVQETQGSDNQFGPPGSGY